MFPFGSQLQDFEHIPVHPCEASFAGCVSIIVGSALYHVVQPGDHRSYWSRAAPLQEVFDLSIMFFDLVLLGSGEGLESLFPLAVPVFSDCILPDVVS